MQEYDFFTNVTVKKAIEPLKTEWVKDQFLFMRRHVICLIRVQLDGPESFPADHLDRPKSVYSHFGRFPALALNMSVKEKPSWVNLGGEVVGGISLQLSDKESQCQG